MAELVLPPEGFDPPELTVDAYRDGSWQRIEQDYIDRLAAEARKGSGSTLVGKEVRWQRGDGYARYLVWSIDPLQLIHLGIGDAWTVEDALIRGLDLADVDRLVSQLDRLAELFGRK